jgi:large subunit ribosomal protein L6e
VNQRYVIATTTKVPLTGVDVSKVDDAVFKREKADDAKDDDLANTAKPTVISPERKAMQSAIDTALTKNIEKVDMLSNYMKAKFSLSKNDKPHMMKF